MNPQGGVSSDVTCGCPNVLVDDVYGGVSGPKCSMLPGYQSVYDPLANIEPIMEGSMAEPAPLEVATAEPVAAKGAHAHCYNNTNTPNVTQYGPYPIQAEVVAGQVGKNDTILPTLAELRENATALTSSLRSTLGLWMRTLVWVAILVALGAVLYLNRKRIMSWLPFGKKPVEGLHLKR